MEITLRPAVAGDLNEIGRLWLELMELHSALQPQRLFRPDAWEYRRRDFERALGTPETNRVLLAEHAGVPAGVLWCEIRGAIPNSRLQPARYAEIETLVVAEAARGRGVGECLMRACQEWLAGNSVTRIALKVVAENQDARRFYERLGYRAVTVIMEKDG